jgi:hypothetical protein
MSNPRYSIDQSVSVISENQKFSGTVLGVQFVVPVWFYVVALDDPIETDQGLQKGIYVPESSLMINPSVKEWALVGTYVYVLTEEQMGKGEHPAAIDVRVKIGEGSDDLWYIQTEDELDGDELWTGETLDSQEEALEMALDIIKDNHEADEGEDAAAYLERLALERVTPCPPNPSSTG